MLAQNCRIISYAGQLGKDEVGLDSYLLIKWNYIFRPKGKTHVQLILEKIFSAQKKHAQTNISVRLDIYCKTYEKKMRWYFLFQILLMIILSKNFHWLRAYAMLLPCGIN